MASFLTYPYFEESFLLIAPVRARVWGCVYWAVAAHDIARLSPASESKKKLHTWKWKPEKLPQKEQWIKPIIRRKSSDQDSDLWVNPRIDSLKVNPLITIRRNRNESHFLKNTRVVKKNLGTIIIVWWPESDETLHWFDSQCMSNDFHEPPNDHNISKSSFPIIMVSKYFLSQWWIALRYLQKVPPNYYGIKVCSCTVVTA